ncbi:Gfo/Idh/MocA family protein [Paenibacillus shunpengii]|uniref:Gfo/Idh/MocA family protein n=1 Tax=Paenibacillus shunpengii TaxID=2054424 RepID=A0ABW5STQ1_9BACL|nr:MULTISPECIES: Gfo/Idh/MocA family oxidoreductase [unclassified Paenibacillus]OMC65357.1 oxidoreductase [Paenibacillus sp. FSL H7-0326]SDX18088.1 Predicted dehydrogenase [Paenibacillus sp. PDC88]
MVRFGIIGTNKITVQFIEAASTLPDFKLTAVYSRTEERGREFAEQHGAEHVFTDLEEMAQSDVLDAVYIASPNSYHSKQAVLLMQHGKHILCEKPMASNSKELADMVAAAEANKVVLMEAMKSTLMPGFKAMQEHILKLGQVRKYMVNYCQYSSRYDAYKQGDIQNAFKPEFSNGSLMDIGIYCIYPMVVLFGQPENVKATSVMLDSGVDGEGSIVLQYKDMEGVISYSKITNSYLPSEIQGEEGSMIIDHINVPGAVTLRYRNGDSLQISELDEAPAMKYEAEEFIRLVQSGELQSVNNSHQHSSITMEIMDTVRKQIGLVYPADR